jgi:hypothetical protein
VAILPQLLASGHVYLRDFPHYSAPAYQLEESFFSPPVLASLIMMIAIQKQLSLYRVEGFLFLFF